MQLSDKYGPTDDFGRFFDEYRPRLIAFARGYVRDRLVAEDLATDSFLYFWENRSRIDTEHDWQKAMDHYLSGYKASKKRGDELGFDVILGAELRFPQNDNDYLVYGIDEDWLRSNPYMCCTSAREFYEKFHNEVL